MGKRVLDFDGYVQNHTNTNESKFGDFISKVGSAISIVTKTILKRQLERYDV